MSYLAYTIFADAACTQVRQVVHAEGEKAERILAAFRSVKGWEPQEGEIIAGCRIDRIGSEVAIAA